MKGLIVLITLLLTSVLFAQYEYKASEMFSMKVNGEPVFVEYYKEVPDEMGGSGVRWKLEDVSISHFFFTGEVEVEVTVNAAFTDYNLSPKRYGIESTREGNTIKFKIDRPIKLNINMDNEDIVNEQLFIFADALEDRPDLSLPNVKNIMSFLGANNSGKLEITRVIQDAINSLADGDILYFPPGQYLTKTIKLKSNMTLYLESGAMLLGTEKYSDYKDDYSMVLIKNCSNTSIKGFGRINQRGEKMQVDYGNMCFSHNIKIIGTSNNIKLEDIFSIDPPRLNIEVSGDYTTLYNVRALATQAGENTDGINPWKASHVVYDNCFIYGRDDNIAIKRYFNDFVTRNSVLTSLEGTQKIGTETNGSSISNIVFENNDLLYSGHAMSIWSRDGATIDDVWYRNIGVERIKPSPYGGQGMPFYFTILPRDGANPGSITNLHIQKVKCEMRSQGVDGKSFMAGNDADSKINNIQFDDLIIADTLITEDNYKNFFNVGIDSWHNSYVENLGFGTANYALVEVKADNIDVTEGGTSSFTITRTGDLTPSFTVEYWIRGTAENGVDYNTISNSVNFASGQSTATVNIVTVADTKTERIEQVYISLKSDADKAFMLAPLFNAMINIRDANFSGNIVISDPIIPGSGPANRIETENMGLNNYIIESNNDASEQKMIKVPNNNPGIATYISERSSGNYNIATCYIAEEDGAPSYKLFINNNEVDSWSATKTASTWEFLTHTSQKVFIGYGDEIKIEGTPNEGAAARLDYIDIIDYEDTEAPVPNPMTFSLLPFASGTSHITMSAKGFDLSGVEYYFENITDANHSSGWQDDTLYVDTGLDENSEYTYRVKARDKSANNNETDFSSAFSATTLTNSGTDSTYIEQNGICVMEGENGIVSNNNDSTGWSSPFTGPTLWYEENIEAGFVGSGYMTTQDGVSLNASWATGTELAWPVEITNEGEYWIAVRRIAKTGQDDSAFPGVDGIKRYNGSSTFNEQSEAFTWVRSNKSLGVLSKGTRVIQVRRREDGFMLDRAMIANSESNLPADGSNENGPAESPRGGEVSVKDKLVNNTPKSFKLNAAYPNPFNPSTTLSYALPQTSEVSIIIYDVMGRKIKTLISGKQNAGNHRVSWNADNDNGSHVSSGVYLFRITAGKFSDTGRLLYLK